MKRIAVLSLFLFAVILSGCSKPIPTPEFQTKLAPADLSMRLDISQLPEGVEDVDISLRSLTDDEMPFVVEGASVQGWEFEPSGIVFTEPASMTVALASGSLPYVFHVSETGFSLVEGVRVDIQGDQYVANVPVRGFSSFVLVDPAKDKAYFSKKVGEGMVGEDITLRLQVDLSRPEFTLLPGSRVSQTYYIRPEGMTLDGEVQADPESDVHHNYDAMDRRMFGKPGKILGGQGNQLATTMFNQKYTIVTEGFRCERPGTAFVNYFLNVNLVVNSVEEDSLGDYLQLDKLGGNIDWFTQLRVRGEVVCHPKPVEEPEPKCGNHILETGEQCDRYHLNKQTCETQGYAGGTLGCNAECQFDYTQCIVSQSYSCAENAWEGTNMFRPSYDVCQDDCPEGQRCSAYSCTCVYDSDEEEVDLDPLISLPVEPPLTTHTVPGAGWDFADTVLTPAEQQASDQAVQDILNPPQTEPEDTTLPGVDDDDDDTSTTRSTSSVQDSVGQDRASEPEKVQAIKYNGQYISVDDVVKCDGSECNGQEHWHVLASSLRDIYGNPVNLPVAGECGVSLGTTKQVPVETVEK